MEYISAEEFLKQDKEVQKVFLDWWQPSFGDLISWSLMNKNCMHIDFIDESDIRNKNLKNDLNNFKIIIPLLTEGQLRKFIEDKTGYKIIPNYTYEGNIIIDFITIIEDIETYGLVKGIDAKETDLLQAYWKVACEIAKEQIQ